MRSRWERGGQRGPANQRPQHERYQWWDDISDAIIGSRVDGRYVWSTADLSRTFNRTCSEIRERRAQLEQEQQT